MQGWQFEYCNLIRHLLFESSSDRPWRNNAGFKGVNIKLFGWSILGHHWEQHIILSPLIRSDDTDDDTDHDDDMQVDDVSIKESIRSRDNQAGAVTFDRSQLKWTLLYLCIDRHFRVETYRMRKRKNWNAFKIWTSAWLGLWTVIPWLNYFIVHEESRKPCKIKNHYW